MEILVLNSDLFTIGLIDAFESLIWTDRYYETGDFELYTPISDEILAIPNGSFLVNPESEHVMVVEKTVITTDIEQGTHVTKSGKSAEGLLARRILWSQVDLSGSFQNAIKYLLDTNIINPEDNDRAIPNFVFKASTDPDILAMEVETQIPIGSNLHDVVSQLCEEKGVGFKVTINSQRKLEFMLYMGTDHSYLQNDQPRVIFSPEFDNLFNSNYQENSENYKTTALVAGPGDVEDMQAFSLDLDGYTGINRNEVFIDASSVSYDNDEGDISDEGYDNLLKQFGLEEMTANYSIEQSFEGEVEASITFKYGQDFYLGDIVQMENEYGMGGAARLTEMVHSLDSSGIHSVPTFVAISGAAYTLTNVSGSVASSGRGVTIGPISDARIDEIIV